MERTIFEEAYNAVDSWTPSQCVKMAMACNMRIAEETDSILEETGLFEDDPLYQPMTEAGFIHELKQARAESMAGNTADAMILSGAFGCRNGISPY